MMHDRDRDLVLESTGNRWWDRDKVETVLPNIPNQRYVIGSVYPGAREGEEFVFIRHYNYNGNGGPGPMDAVHCAISVDGQGQYWLENCTDQANANTTFKTLLNTERVTVGERRLLKSGDSVSFWGPEAVAVAVHPCQVLHVNYVKESIIPSSDLQDGLANEVSEDPNSPLANDLILSEIMSYLPVKDLKAARLVSKKWKAEASHRLEKRGSVSFEFKDDYLNSENSTRVLRYLHELRDLKVRNLQITLSTHKALLVSPGNLGQKMLDDIRKLLKSPNNFSTLLLKPDIKQESDFIFLSTIFQELGRKLVELSLEECLQFFPKVVAPLPLMTNLRKFTHYGPGLGLYDHKEKWAALLIPLFFNNLEDFRCCKHMADPYLKAFQVMPLPLPKLRGIGIEGIARSEETLHLLLSLKNSLAFLDIHIVSYSCPQFEFTKLLRLLEKLLLKHSNSLQSLVITINSVGFADIKFPKFPKLEEFSLSYYGGTRIGWQNGKSLDYKEHFPSLRKLAIRPGILWSREDPVFNVLFPENGGLSSETLRDLNLAVYLNPHDPLLTEAFQLRRNKILEMFPNAWTTFFG